MVLIMHRWRDRCWLNLREGCTTSSCEAARGRLSSGTTGIVEDSLRRLARHGRGLEIRVFAYCLMDKHLRMTIGTEKTQLSRVVA